LLQTPSPAGEAASRRPARLPHRSWSDLPHRASIAYILSQLSQKLPRREHRARIRAICHHKRDSKSAYSTDPVHCRGFVFGLHLGSG
jgi:hypothetical protein